MKIKKENLLSLRLNSLGLSIKLIGTDKDQDQEIRPRISSMILPKQEIVSSLHYSTTCADYRREK